MAVKLASAFIERCSSYSDLMEKTLGNDPAAYTYGVLSELFFFVANLGVILIPGMDSGTALMIRGISSMIIALTMSKAQGIPLHLNSHLFKVVTIRNFFVGMHILMIFYCIGKLPVSLIYIIEQTAPLWIFIINYFQYGLQIRIKDIFIFIASMVGVCMITFPQTFSQIFSSLFSVSQQPEQNTDIQQNDEATSNDKYYQGTARLILVIIYSMSMISFSFGLLYIKKAKEHLSVIQIIFNQGIQYLIFGSVLSLNQKEVGLSFQLSAETIINGMMLIGTFSYIYQIMYLRGSIITTNHGKYAMTGYSAVLFSYIYEILILGELPNLLQIIGLVIVVVALLNN
ncbi:hypothetical protein ABPG72_006834 [Tetrahymena utriculariae]